MTIKNVKMYSMIIFYLFTFDYAFATTNCKQAFTFLGMTQGTNPTFWITEELSAECDVTYLVQVAIHNSNATLISTEMELDGNCSRLKELMKCFVTETPVELINKNDIWKPGDESWFIKAPTFNQNHIIEFKKHISEGGNNGRSWNDERKLKGVLVPEINSVDARMIYFYPSGLYINYDISKAYYFPKSGYILIFTSQKKLAVGLDTMHGFILLRMI